MHEFTLIPSKSETGDNFVSDDGDVFPYPYRGLPAVRSHIAPLYAVWNAGPKLAEKGIPEIARHFCEFVRPNKPGPPPTQPDRITEIESRLGLVAEIWNMIMAVGIDAANWGKGAKNLKRKRFEDFLDLNAPPSSIRTSIPSPRMSTCASSRMSAGAPVLYSRS